MMFEILGVLSSVIFILGDIPYFLDTLKGSTKPHRVSWGIAFLLNIIGFANQYAAGATNSLWLFGAAVIATGAIFIASLFKGVGGRERLDIIALVIALMGVALWSIASDPAVSIFANLVAGGVSVYPTIRKAKKQPQTETVSAFLFGSISSLLATVSVGKIEFLLLVLPIYSTFVQAYLVYLIAIRPKSSRKKS